MRLGGKLRLDGQHCIHRGNWIFMQIIFSIIRFFPFFHLERNTFGGLSSKTCQQGCNHCVLCVDRVVLRKKNSLIFRKNYDFITCFGDCAENFGVVVNNAITEEMGSLCRSFFSKCIIFTAFSPWAKHFWRPSVKPSSARL